MFQPGLNSFQFCKPLPQLEFWPKAPDFMRARPYAGPTCTRCPGPEGPADTYYYKHVIQICTHKVIYHTVPVYTHSHLYIYMCSYVSYLYSQRYTHAHCTTVQSCTQHPTHNVRYLYSYFTQHTHACA